MASGNFQVVPGQEAPPPSVVPRFRTEEEFEARRVRLAEIQRRARAEFEAEELEEMKKRAFLIINGAEDYYFWLGDQDRLEEIARAILSDEMPRSDADLDEDW